MSNLPYDARIEYLESTGTQIINTGVSGGTNAEYGLRLMILEQSASWVHICGSVRNAIGAPKIQRASSTDDWRAEWYNGSSTNVVILTQDANIHTIEYKGGKVYVDAVEKCSPGTMGFGSLDFCIFNYLAESMAGSNIQLYSAWVKLDGVLVRDFTPVRVGNVGYLYDKVSETLFGNSGTGSFVLGGDRVLPNPFGFRRRLMTRMNAPYDSEVEYLQTDGNAYIDTGIKSASTTSFNLSFTLPDDILSATINGTLFGGRVSVNNGDMSVFMPITDSTHPFHWRYRNSVVATTTTIVGGNTYNFSNLSSANTLSINNVNTTASAGTFSTNVNMYIFTLNANGSAWACINGIRFNGGQLYSNGVLVRNYIPVRKNGIGYLYDKVSGGLFGNANSVGAFTYGNDKII